MTEPDSCDLAVRIKSSKMDLPMTRHRLDEGEACRGNQVSARPLVTGFRLRPRVSPEVGSNPAWLHCAARVRPSSRAVTPHLQRASSC